MSHLGFLKILGAGLAALVLLTPAGRADDFGGGPPGARYFQLQWDVTQGDRGRPAVSGYINNTYGRWAKNVRLLVEELDASGQVVSQVIGYVDQQVPGFGRAYFEVPIPRKGTTCRVTVLSFDWVDHPGFRILDGLKGRDR